jgi:DnaJ family protein C protein 8
VRISLIRVTPYSYDALVIHPDKTPHPRAPEAFDLLKKVCILLYTSTVADLAQAESELSDKDKRENIDAVIAQSRSLILKSLSLSLTTPSTDPALRRLDPSFRVRMRTQTKELLIEEELRRRKAIKMNLANEGLEARMKDAEVAGKKRKAEEDKVWEGMSPSPVRIHG